MKNNLISKQNYNTNDLSLLLNNLESNILKKREFTSSKVSEIKVKEKNKENLIYDKVIVMTTKLFSNKDKINNTTKISHQNLPIMIFDWLLLGDAKISSDKELLKHYKVDSILNSALECRNYHTLTFIYKKIPVCDTPKTNIKFYFDDASNFLEENRKKGNIVYVHCYKGRSRSVSLIISYMIKYMNYSYESAFSHIKKLKTDVNPNYGFVEQLKKYKEEMKLNK